MTALRKRLFARLDPESDTGSTLPLVIGLGTLVLALVFTIASASSLYLERKRLLTLADGAALVGAESFELSTVTRTGGSWEPRLSSRQVRLAVTSYLTGTPIGEFTDLRLESAATPDGLTATVTVSALWRPPIVGEWWPASLRIDATSSARSVFH